LNPKNIGAVMLDMRKTNGAGIIAEKSIPSIEQAQSDKVIVDGLRSLDEADVFKTNFPSFSLIAVHASPKTRFTRLNRRNRSDDPKEWAVFHERDIRELSVGLGNAIAMAEYIIINEEDKKFTKACVEEALAKVEERWQR
jgi:dephospho-CoA kinase